MEELPESASVSELVEIIQAERRAQLVKKTERALSLRCSECGRSNWDEELSLEYGVDTHGRDVASYVCGGCLNDGTGNEQPPF